MSYGALKQEDGEKRERLCVLVADDEQDMREEVARALGGDFHIIEIDSGDRVIQYLRGCVVSEGRVRMPDAIVSDIRMPGCSGFDVLKAVRDLSVDIPVILMTAFGDSTTHQEARQLGAVETFDKPFDADDFRIAVLCACSSRRGAGQ
ncbi:response regulator [Myxococcota bacterium]